MTTPTTERETVLGILRELQAEMRQLAERHEANMRRFRWGSADAAYWDGANDAYSMCANLAQQRIDAIEREEQE